MGNVGFAMMTTLITAVGGAPSLSDALDGESARIIPVQAVRVADDNGSRRTLVTLAEVADWVAYANQAFSVAGIGFSFDPNAGDFSDLNSTLINNVTGVNDANWRTARAFANAVAAGYPGKLVVFFRWGPGASQTGAGFSWWDYNFIAAPGFDTSVCNHQNISLLAHEIGHYLGLPHTFAATFHTNTQAESYYVAHGRDPYIFDGDGIVDTLPDPFIGALQCDTPNDVTLAGDVFPLQTDNIMTYWDSAQKTFTPDQVDRITWLLDLRLQFDMAMPTNYGTPNTQEFDSLVVTAASNIGYGFQDMTGFGLDQWAENDHLFCGSGSNGWISFRVNVPYTDTYDLDLYATRAPDFAIIGVWWDGIRKGGDIDLYAPLVVPTDELALGTVSTTAGNHRLTVQIVGRNPASPNYSFGLDAVALEPVGCNCDSVPGGCQARIGFLTTCLTGPGVTLASAVPGCKNLCGDTFDSDGDQDVDLADVSVWMQQVTTQLASPAAMTLLAPTGLPTQDACTAQQFRAASTND